MLSPAYQTIKSLRSSGSKREAYERLRLSPPASDEEAFEAALCLFVCEDFAAVHQVCSTRRWSAGWIGRMAQALDLMLTEGDSAQALAMAREAAREHRLSADAAAIFLMLLHASGLHDEADAYARSRWPDMPAGETLLLAALAETALAVEDWRQAYKLAAAVISINPDDPRALLVLSRANHAVGNYHEALGNAFRAYKLNPGSAAAILQMMRCFNQFGDYHMVIGLRHELAPEAFSPGIHVELGTAYAGISDNRRAREAFQTALAGAEQPIAALQGLAKVLAADADHAGLQNLERQHLERMHNDIECLAILAKAALAQRNLPAAGNLLEESRRLSLHSSNAAAMLPWPVPEPRLRHELEQLELLAQRGLLDDSGLDALAQLRRFQPQPGDVHEMFQPEGRDAEVLSAALTAVHHYRSEPFSGPALGDNDYKAIEEQYLSGKPRLVAIDNFLSSAALAALRRHCEESSIWKFSAGEGYLGALLTQGFAPPVLLSIADALRDALPRIIGDLPLLQAWAFKYDQRLQGINMHADFALVNLNFWITPEEACIDKNTGGLVVYDVPVPTHWTFADYNTNQMKLKAYLEANNARGIRVPYRENRCLLFDSSLIHVTDEVHFRPGYTNRRVNITLLYGQARSIG